MGWNGSINKKTKIQYNTWTLETFFPPPSKSVDQRRWKTTCNSCGLGPGSLRPSWKSDKLMRWAFASRKKVSGAGLETRPFWEPSIIDWYQPMARLIPAGKSRCIATVNKRSSSFLESSISQDMKGHSEEFASSKASLTLDCKEAGHTKSGSWLSSLLAMVSFTKQKMSKSSGPTPIARGFRPWTGAFSGMPGKKCRALEMINLR